MSPPRALYLLLWITCTSICRSFAQSQPSQSELAAEFQSALISAKDCTSCAAVLTPMQGLAKLGDQALVGTLVTTCIALGLEDPVVCTGAIGQQGPILAHDLRQISVSGRTATMFCEAVFGLCPPVPPMPFNFTFPPPPPAVTHPRLPSMNHRSFRVVHFSDVHIDRQYTVGTEANCTLPLCCRANDNSNTPSANITVPAQPYGNSHCDSPSILAQSMIDAINALKPKPDFAIFTGDVVEGAVWSVDKLEAKEDLKKWNDQMFRGFGLDIPVYPTLGNHDTSPTNAFPRSTTTPVVNASESQFVYDTQSIGWKPWIGQAAAQDVAVHSGVYSVKIPGRNLRIISLDTNFYYKQNFWFYDSDDFQPDPNGLLSILISQLHIAELAGDKVWIIGHIPPGKADAFNDQSHYFTDIITRFQATITGLFFGHSHKDEFEIGYSDYSQQSFKTANFVAHVAPALTPTSGNPAFKIYDIDGHSFEVMDSSVWFANVSDLGFQDQPTWRKLYTARNLYGPLVTPPLPPFASLSPAFYHNLTEVFETDDTVFQTFNALKSRNLIGQVTACTGSCKTTSVCDARALRAENNCDVRQPGIMFKRNGQYHVAGLGNHVNSEDVCHGHSVGWIMRKVMQIRDESLS